ncbi:hypothetical protein [Nesterenkonia sp.]|uniref:hypothetical protein n=1 Tax=Nesterenkonia sp. TaxID=704201 RepID=UPI00262AB685|nr:hypothetical protein [Nesterenkonia sp.]
MTTNDIRDDARQEAERRWPSYPAVGFSGASDRQQAFIDGAIWASEQAEAIDRMGSAAGCAYCVGAGGYEDYDGEWRECSSCQRADREPSDAEVEAAGEAIWGRGWRVPKEVVRAALLAAQEVNRGSA